MNQTILPEDKMRSLRTLTLVIYALYAAGFITAISPIAGIIINYIKQDEVAGTWLESHFRWQMRTFWFGLLWGVVGMVLTIALVGFLILGVNAIWIIYRLVKGFLKLNDNQPVEAYSRH
jgi:uncharacterized membrane protein